MNTIKKYIALMILFMTPLGAQELDYDYTLNGHTNADWLVVGAGPAGIVTVGMLLDIGVNPSRITWLDPEFNVGRMGTYYTHVPSNSKAKEFIEFITICKVFQECSGPEIDALKALNPSVRGYELDVLVQPLKVITQHLKTKVNAIQDTLTALYFTDNVWNIQTQHNGSLSADHVVLATGGRPKTITYENNGALLPLDEALDKAKLATMVEPSDIVGVIGSSHSAILILKFLTEIGVEHIYNFYRSPLQYLFDVESKKPLYNPLKGIAAEWAKNVLEANPPANLSRVYCKNPHLDPALKICNKIIYAVGYERNELPAINDTTPITAYNEHNGVIAPRLFGIGLAFPEYVVDAVGNERYCIGLDCFMEYAQRLIPQWAHDEMFKSARWQMARAQLNKLKEMASLFTIHTL